MNESVCNDLDKDNLGIVAGRLWRLQDELDNLESKLSRTVLSVESLLEEGEEKEPEITNETNCEIIGETSKSKVEDKLHHRTLAGVNKATADCRRMVNTVDVDDLKKPEVITSDDLGAKTYTWKTCDYWSLPKWLQSNPYILKGYRPPLPSLRVCFFSIFRIHTETGNIWTHLLGCLLFIALFLHAALSALPLEDKLVLSPFFLGAIFCLGVSSSFHTLLCHSQTTLNLCGRLDYCGINLLIIGSFIPWLYYGFFCDTKVKILYLAGVLTLGACATVLSLSQTFNQPLYRPLRATVFVMFGLSGVVPGIHFILLDGWDSFLEVGTPLLITGMLYIAGAVIYAVSVPERIFPGKCDILFQSHQIFHVLVLLATVIDYIGIVRVSVFVQFGRNNPDFCPHKQLYYGKLHYSYI